jgi:hypothetical protein
MGVMLQASGLFDLDHLASGMAAIAKSSNPLKVGSGTVVPVPLFDDWPK